MNIDNHLASLQTQINDIMRRQDELDLRLSTRISAAEDATLLHGQSDSIAFNKLNTKIASVQARLASIESAHEANSMAQMHILGLVARKVGVSEKELKKVKVF